MISRVSTWSALRKRLSLLADIRGPGEAALAANILVVAACAPTLMRLPLGRVTQTLEPRAAPGAVSAAHQQRVLRLVEIVLEVFAPILRPTCLTRGITRYYFLRRAGMDIALVFGMGQPIPNTTAGHCWLVCAGQPFLESRDPRPFFTEMFRIAPLPVS